MSYVEPRPLPPGQRLVDEMPVRTYGPVPVIPPEQWTLVISGDTASGQPTTLTWGDLQGMGAVDVEGDLHCVSRATAQDLHWRGVPVRDIVRACPPAPGVEHALVFAQLGYSATVRMDDLTSPRALVATHLDGEPLMAERGGPARLVIPHLYGYKGPKWVREIEYTAFPERGFWEQRGYHVRGDAWRQERYSYQE